MEQFEKADLHLNFSAIDPRSGSNSDPRHSRRTNLFRRSRDPRQAAFLDGVAEHSFANIGQRNRPSIAAYSQFNKCVHAVCLDLYSAFVDDPSLHVGYSRTASQLSSKDRYNPGFMSRSQFLKAVDGLRSAGYVKATKMGSELSGCSSRMQPEPKLLEAMAQFAPSKLELAATQGEETILMTKWHKSLHERKRERLPYYDTDRTRTFRENLGSINEVLNRHWYDLEDQTG